MWGICWGICCVGNNIDHFVCTVHALCTGKMVNAWSSCLQPLKSHFFVNYTLLLATIFTSDPCQYWQLNSFIHNIFVWLLLNMDTIETINRITGNKFVPFQIMKSKNWFKAIPPSHIWIILSLCFSIWWILLYLWDWNIFLIVDKRKMVQPHLEHDFQHNEMQRDKCSEHSHGRPIVECNGLSTKRHDSSQKNQVRVKQMVKYLGSSNYDVIWQCA